MSFGVSFIYLFQIKLPAISISIVILGIEYIYMAILPKIIYGNL